MGTEPVRFRGTTPIPLKRGARRAKVDGFAESHQRAPHGAHRTMICRANLCSVRKAKTTLFAFRGAKRPGWTFCDPISVHPSPLTWSIRPALIRFQAGSSGAKGLRQPAGELSALDSPSLIRSSGGSRSPSSPFFSYVPGSPGGISCHRGNAS